MELTPCSDHDRWMGGCAGCDGATTRATEKRIESLEAERDRLRVRESALHYAIRTTANIIDKKTADESQAECLLLVTKMRAVWEAAHEVDKVFSRDAPMMLVASGIEAEKKLEAMRVVLDAPVSSFGTK